MWFNLFAFNISWLGLILWGNSFIPAVISWLLLHIFLSPDKQAEMRLLVFVACIGIGVDFALTYLSIFQFNQGQFFPVWLMVLWIAFAATLNHSLAFLSVRRVYQWLAGTIFAPLSYLAGERLGAVVFGLDNLHTYLLLALLWGPLMLFFFYIKANCLTKGVHYA